MTRYAAVVVVIAFGTSAPAADPEKPADRAKALIDKLTELAEQDIGYSGSDSGSAFLPLGRNERGALLLWPRKGEFGPSGVLKSLVKLGADAVPELLKHLDDDRKTKIVIDCTGLFGAPEDPKYVVRVGDLCYVALGQIVNRDYAAVRYIPTAIVAVAEVPKNAKLRERLVKEWGNLTAEAHRKSLVNDFAADRTRLGASIRLAYYYPDELEALVLKQLARPYYDQNAVWDLFRDKLYPAKTARERKELVDAFVMKYGDIARDGIRWQLFHDLDTQIKDEMGWVNPPYGDKRPKARECLIDVFGFTDKVTPKDGPKQEPNSIHDNGELLDRLLYDRSAKIDRAVRDLLATTDSDYFAYCCIRRLVGRGYDADIAAYIKRQLATAGEREKEILKEYEAKIGWTYLHRAVDADVPGLIEAALKDKLEVNAQGKDGRTALHLAAAEGKGEALAMLLAAKADPNVKDADGKLAVQLAAFGEYPQIVRRLIAAKSPIPDALVAAVVGDADRLAELLKADSGGTKLRTKDGFTPLHVAAGEGHEKAVGVLLAAGADVNSLDMPGWHRDKVSFQEYTPLHMAAMAGKAGVAKMLLDKGAKVDAADKFGKHSPLHHAAGLGHVEVVKLLLEHKADRGLKDEEGRTPLDLAKERNHTAVVKLLEAGK